MTKQPCEQPMRSRPRRRNGKVVEHQPCGRLCSTKIAGKWTCVHHRGKMGAS